MKLLRIFSSCRGGISVIVALAVIATSVSVGPLPAAAASDSAVQSLSTAANEPEGNGLPEDRVTDLAAQEICMRDPGSAKHEKCKIPVSEWSPIKADMDAKVRQLSDDPEFKKLAEEARGAATARSPMSQSTRDGVIKLVRYGASKIGDAGRQFAGIAEKFADTALTVDSLLSNGKLTNERAMLVLLSKMPLTGSVIDFFDFINASGASDTAGMLSSGLGLLAATTAAICPPLGVAIGVAKLAFDVGRALWGLFFGGGVDERDKVQELLRDGLDVQWLKQPNGLPEVVPEGDHYVVTMLFDSKEIKNKPLLRYYVGSANILATKFNDTLGWATFEGTIPDGPFKGSYKKKVTVWGYVYLLGGKKHEFGCGGKYETKYQWHGTTYGNGVVGTCKIYDSNNMLAGNGAPVMVDFKLRSKAALGCFKEGAEKVENGKKFRCSPDGGKNRGGGDDLFQIVRESDRHVVDFPISLFPREFPMNSLSWKAIDS